MDRTLVFKMDIRQSAMFDDILLMIDDFSDEADERLSNVLINVINGKQPPDIFKYTTDIIDKLQEEISKVINRCAVDKEVYLVRCERTPLKNVLTLYIRIEL